MTRSFLLSMLYVISGLLCAQRTAPSFLVGECPRASGHTLEEVNAAVAGLRTEQEFIAAMRGLFARLSSGCIPYAAMQPDGRWRDRYFLVSAGRSTDTDMATLGSKGVGDEVIRTRPQLAALLHDTLVVLAPLRIRLDLTADGYNASDYFAQWGLPGGDTFTEQPLVAYGDTLILDQSLFGLQDGGLVELVLRHRSKPRALLGRVWLHYLRVEQAAELRTALCGIRGPADPSDGERQEIAMRLVKDLYGRAYAPNVSALVCDR